MHDVAHDPRGHIRRGEWTRCERAHPTRIRPAIAIEHALMVFGRRQRNRTRAIGEDEKRQFAADEIFLDHELGTGVAKSAIDHRGCDRRFGFGACCRDHDALSGGKAVGLDHDGESEFVATDDLHRGVGGLANLSARCGDPVAGHERLRERLARFERGRRLRRAEDQPPVFMKPIDDTATERQLGTDDREVDRFARGECDERVGIRGVGTHDPCERRDARVAWRAHDLGDGALTREAPDQRMFAPAAADDQDLHEWCKSRLW
jgi:hypothetical protein